MVINTFDSSMLVGQVLFSLPFLLVTIAGVVICMVRESRPVRVRIAVGCSLLLQLGLLFVLPALLGYVMGFFQSNPGHGGLSRGVVVVNLVSSFISATSLGLLLYAAFTRDDSSPAPADAIS